MQQHVTQPFTLSALFRLTRFWNLVIICMAQYAAAVFLIDSSLIFNSDLLFLSMSTAFVAAAGYIINDYYDVKIDLINKPERVVIGKNITRRYAILFHTSLSISGVIIGLLLDWRIGIINFLSAFFLWFYSNNLKRQPFIGNFVVAVLTGLSIMLVNFLFEMSWAGNTLVIIYSLFAFFMTLVREMIKDMEDLRGDNTFGCKTLPIIWGLRKAKLLVYIILIIFAFSVFIINRLFVGLPMYYFILLLFLPLGWLFMRLIRADTVKDFYKLSQLCKLIMLLGISSMVFI